jgi:hypothetical protein
MPHMQPQPCEGGCCDDPCFCPDISATWFALLCDFGSVSPTSPAGSPDWYYTGLDLASQINGTLLSFSLALWLEDGDDKFYRATVDVPDWDTSGTISRREGLPPAYVDYDIELTDWKARLMVYKYCEGFYANIHLFAKLTVGGVAQIQKAFFPDPEEAGQDLIDDGWVQIGATSEILTAEIVCETPLSADGDIGGTYGRPFQFNDFQLNLPVWSGKFSTDSSELSC